MYSELLIELEADQGTIYASGRAAALWLDEAGICSGSVQKDAIYLREPSPWETELFQRTGCRPATETGPPLLGETKTLFFWCEDTPAWVFVETEETPWIDRLSLWPPAETILRRYHPDALSVRFRFPAALLELGSSCFALHKEISF